jgi:hypothetical protein
MVQANSAHARGAAIARVSDVHLGQKMAPAVGLEPSWEDGGSRDSGAITPKGVDGETSLNPSESESWDAARTHVPDSDSIGAILVRARLAWGALRVI